MVAPKRRNDPGYQNISRQPSKLSSSPESSKTLAPLAILFLKCNQTGFEVHTEGIARTLCWTISGYNGLPKQEGLDISNNW